MVDIICEKISEGAENEQSSNQTNNNPGNSGPNYRAGQTAGATKLTDSANNSGLNSQSCQC